MLDATREAPYRGHTHATPMYLSVSGARHHDIKLPLYALARIPEVWIMDLDGGEVEVYREPEGNRYRLEDRARTGQTLSHALVPILHVPMDDILV